MVEVIIIGAGGHAAEIDEYIAYSQKVCGNKNINIIGFLDDNPSNYSRYRFSAPLLGGARDHNINTNYAYIIGIADLHYRRFFVDRFKAAGAQFLSFIHCNAYVSPTSVIAEGSIVGPNVNVGPNVRIGSFTLINSRCSIGHDSVIGDFNFICPNVCFSGFTTIGNENFFGINSATVPKMKVGNRNKIAAGMILNQNVDDDSVVFYRYKERIFAITK